MPRRKELSEDLRSRIVDLHEAGKGYKSISKSLDVHVSTVRQTVYKWRTFSTVATLPRRGRPVTMTAREQLYWQNTVKCKNVDPAQAPPTSHPQAALENGSQKIVVDQAAWEGDQLWNLLQENESGQNKPREPASNRLPGPSIGTGASCDVPPCSSNQDGIKIVSVTSLSKDGGQYGKQNVMPGGISVGPQPGHNCSVPQASVPGTSSSAPVVPSVAQHNLNGKGKVCVPPARNPALIVKRKIVGRAIHLQKKASVQNGQNPLGASSTLSFMLRAPPTTFPSRGTPPALAASLGCNTHAKDASTQTSTYSTTSPSPQGGGQTAALLAPTASPQSLIEKLDTVHTEVQKLAQAMHMVLERQCRLERQQEQQQRFQQEVLMTLQQLSSTVSHGAVPGNQPCAPYSNMADPSPSLPNFSHFKMELI